MLDVVNVALEAMTLLSTGRPTQCKLTRLKGQRLRSRGQNEHTAVRLCVTFYLLFKNGKSYKVRYNNWSRQFRRESFDVGWGAASYDGAVGIYIPTVRPIRQRFYY